MNSVVKSVQKNEFKVNQAYTISYFIPNVKCKLFNTEIMEIFICDVCGGYMDAKKSIARRIFCTCSDVFGYKHKHKHIDNLTNVLNELIFKKYQFENDKEDSYLEWSRYYHKGECVPDSRTCKMCWHYTCITCDGGIAGMLGKCMYKRCRSGRRNCGLEY